MASNRHLSRIIALQTLYEIEFRRDCQDKHLNVETVLKRNITRYRRAIDDHSFIQTLVRGVEADAAELDIILQPAAAKWPIDQIARVDRLVLRLGLYELRKKDNPVKVVINEAVELAKAFGGERSPQFINGVLGTILEQQTATAAEASPPKPAPTNKKEKPL